jgi:hypothetical protein
VNAVCHEEAVRRASSRSISLTRLESPKSDGQLPGAAAAAVAPLGPELAREARQMAAAAQLQQQQVLEMDSEVMPLRGNAGTARQTNGASLEAAATALQRCAASQNGEAAHFSMAPSSQPTPQDSEAEVDGLHSAAATQPAPGGAAFLNKEPAAGGSDQALSSANPGQIQIRHEKVVLHPETPQEELSSSRADFTPSCSTLSGQREPSIPADLSSNGRTSYRAADADCRGTDGVREHLTRGSASRGGVAGEDHRVPFMARIARCFRPARWRRAHAAEEEEEAHEKLDADEKVLTHLVALPPTQGLTALGIF